MPALELALESKFRESGDSPMFFELSWRPGGSVGILINLFGFFKLTIVVVRGREVYAMGMLGNSTRGLIPLQKCLLYCSCVVPIATYGFRLWFFAEAPTKAQVLLLAAMQRKAALWILGVFCTSPTGGLEALAGLIPIQLHLRKLAKRSCLWTATLPSQHALMSLLSARNSKGTCPHPQSLALLNDANALV